MDTPRRQLIIPRFDGTDTDCKGDETLLGKRKEIKGIQTDGRSKTTNSIHRRVALAQEEILKGATQKLLEINK